MIRIFICLLSLMMGYTNIQAQKYFTREGKVSFFSEAPVEKIEAFNSKATSVLDSSTGKIEFAILIKAFQFEKSLMQEHFNENYMESDKYPKATFKGEIINFGSINLAKDGQYEVKVKGDLSIHGVTKTIEAPGKIIVKEGQITATSSFEVVVADYKIEVPAIVRDNIARTVRIDIAVNYEELNKGS